MSATSFKGVWVDIVNFQQLAMESELAVDTVKLTNNIFCRFDDVIARFRVCKVALRRIPLT